MFNVNRWKNQFLYEENSLAVIPGAYELIEIAQLKKEETNSNVENVTLEPDKNTMKYIMETKQIALRFDVESSIASLLGF